MKLAPHSRVKPDSILDGLTTAVICLDDDLRIILLNQAFESLFGVSRRHALGEPLILGIPHFAPQEGPLRQALQTGSGFIERELQLRKIGEDPITVDCTVTPVVGDKPALIVEVIPLDQHLRASRDEMLQVSHEASRELIRNLAHEIKNPLGGIRGAAQLLEREFPDTNLREFTRVIIREVDRLQNLVNRMLGPNRVPRHVPLNIHEVTEHVCKLIQAEAPTGVAVTRDYDPSIPDLVGDREQLVQAMLNVAKNALQAVGPQGRIVLRTRPRRQLTVSGHLHRLAVQVDVEDNGPGIPDELVEKIFYPMVTTRADGTGLGLPIAQHLVHSHGGVIECKSRPGCTVFSMYLPLERSA